MLNMHVCNLLVPMRNSILHLGQIDAIYILLLRLHPSNSFAVTINVDGAVNSLFIILNCALIHTSHLARGSSLSAGRMTYPRVVLDMEFPDEPSNSRAYQVP